MEVRYLFVLIAVLLAVWLVSTQIRSNTRNRQARQSREKLRNRAADRTLVGRLFGGTRAAGKRKLQEQAVEVTVDADVIPIDTHSAELKSLRSRLQDKDQTILQLQRVLEELTSTTATRESVNFLQKQLITSRAKVLQLEGELKQLRVEISKRRPPVATAPAQPTGETGVQTLSEQSAQSNEAMKAQVADQLKHAETEAEDTQQNALELRRLRSELESVREDRSSARTQIEQLQIRIAEQQKALESVTGQPVSAHVSQSIKPLYATLDDKDDLKLIKGIGPVLEQRLNELGVTTFRQLAGFTEHDIERVSAAIAAFPGRIEREDWVGKAQEMVKRKTHSA